MSVSKEIYEAIVAIVEERLARVILPGYLERHFGIRVSELERRFVGPEGQEVEVNLYGEGEQNGQAIVVLGEAKTRIYTREVEQFGRRNCPRPFD